MEIKRLSEHKIRCALSEEEIQSMGFDIDEIIGDAETTQKFMKMVAEQVREQEDIDMDAISPMVRAELLQDHSMAITFGSDSKRSLKDMLQTVEQLLGQGSSDRPKKPNQQKKDERAEDKNAIFEKTVPFCLEFSDMDEIFRMLKTVPFTDKIPKSSLYKYEGNYYLSMDFIRFSREELRPLAFAIVEYNNKRYAESAQIAFIKEHGKCIVENEALQTLMQL